MPCFKKSEKRNGKKKVLGCKPNRPYSWLLFIF